MSQGAAARGRDGLRQAAEQAASYLPPLLVAAERVAATVAQGVHGRRRVGTGDAFWQFRPYSFGDAVARIDWRRSGRSDAVFLRETEWEAAESIWLWADASPSMNWRSTGALPTKRERSALLLLAASALLIRAGEFVAMLGHDRRPSGGRAALTRFADRFVRGEQGGSLPGFERVPRHAQIVLIGDFLSPLPETAAIVQRYADSAIRGHLVQVLDPAEASLPYHGHVRFEGLEREGRLVLPRVEEVREAYAEKLAHHRDGLAALARTANWTFASHTTDRPPQTALLALHAAMAAPAGWA